MWVVSVTICGFIGLQYVCIQYLDLKLRYGLLFQHYFEDLTGVCSLCKSPVFEKKAGLYFGPVEAEAKLLYCQQPRLQLMTSSLYSTR